MRRRPLVVSLVGILVVAFGALLATVIAGNSPQLGLDLQGGASVTLRPVGDYDPAALDVVPDIYRSRIDSLGVAEPEIIRQGDTVVVNLPGVKDKERAIELIGVTGKVVFRPVLSVLPLAEPIDDAKIPTESATTTTVPGTGTSVAPETSLAGAVTDTTVEDTATTVEDSAATTTGDTTDTSAPAAQGFAAPRAAATSTATPTTTAATETTAVTETTAATETTEPATGTTVPGETTTTVAFEAESLITPAVDDVPEARVFLPNEDGTSILQLGPAFALGENAIEDATATINGSEWTVELTMRGGPLGMDAWNAMTAKCYQSVQTPSTPNAECAQGGMAIVLDHRVISAPRPEIGFFTGNTVVISGGQGGFEESTAKDLARVLKYGSTPIEMRAEAAQTVSATLGKDSLRAGIIAGIVGIVLVVLLMLLYYKSLAVVVVAGLSVSFALLYSVISLLSRTSGLALTLAGVTGIIVSIGVTVDSYVVFFERLKDEVRAGRSFRSSAQRGFKGAWRTILAADTVSLIGAAVLWYLSVGGVRGFAFFLGLSTLCDMVIAYFFTRPAVLLLSRSSRFQGSRVLGVQTGEALAGGVA